MTEAYHNQEEKELRVKQIELLKARILDQSGVQVLAVEPDDNGGFIAHCNSERDALKVAYEWRNNRAQINPIPAADIWRVSIATRTK